VVQYVLASGTGEKATVRVRFGEPCNLPRGHPALTPGPRFGTLAGVLALAIGATPAALLGSNGN
jgi:hypothetical protein